MKTTATSATVDEEGIALAAIKALHADLSAKDRQLADLDAKMSGLEHAKDRELTDLDAKIVRLEQRLDTMERNALSAKP